MSWRNFSPTAQELGDGFIFEEDASSLDQILGDVRGATAAERPPETVSVARSRRDPNPPTRGRKGMLGRLDLGSRSMLLLPSRPGAVSELKAKTAIVLPRQSISERKEMVDKRVGRQQRRSFIPTAVKARKELDFGKAATDRRHCVQRRDDRPDKDCERVLGKPHKGAEPLQKLKLIGHQEKNFDGGPDDGGGGHDDGGGGLDDDGGDNEDDGKNGDVKDPSSSFVFAKPFSPRKHPEVSKCQKSLAMKIMMRESSAGTPRDSLSCLLRQSLSLAELDDIFEDDSTASFENLESRLKTPRRLRRQGPPAEGGAASPSPPGIEVGQVSNSENLVDSTEAVKVPEEEEQGQAGQGLSKVDTVDEEKQMRRLSQAKDSAEFLEIMDERLEWFRSSRLEMDLRQADVRKGRQERNQRFREVWGASPKTLNQLRRSKQPEAPLSCLQQPQEVLHPSFSTENQAVENAGPGDSGETAPLEAAAGDPSRSLDQSGRSADGPSLLQPDSSGLDVLPLLMATSGRDCSDEASIDIFTVTTDGDEPTKHSQLADSVADTLPDEGASDSLSEAPSVTVRQSLIDGKCGPSEKCSKSARRSTTTAIPMSTLIAAANTYYRSNPATSREKVKTVRFLDPSPKPGRQSQEPEASAARVQVSIPVHVGERQGNISINETSLCLSGVGGPTGTPFNRKMDANHLKKYLSTPMALRDISNRAQLELASLYSEATPQKAPIKVLFPASEQDIEN